MASQDTWSGWVAFGGWVLVIVGAIDVIQGFFAILEDEKVVATGKGMAIIDVTGWGWLMLLWGTALILIGLALLGGAEWARWVAIVLVTLSAIAQFAYLANFPNLTPVWTAAVLALDVVVLYALIARWEGYRSSAA
jgi:hypothetical protein